MNPVVGLDTTLRYSGLRYSAVFMIYYYILICVEFSQGGEGRGGGYFTPMTSITLVTRVCYVGRAISEM